MPLTPRIVNITIPQTWAEFDPSATEMIRFDVLPSFLRELPQPLGLSGTPSADDPAAVDAMVSRLEIQVCSWWVVGGLDVFCAGSCVVTTPNPNPWR